MPPKDVKVGDKVWILDPNRSVYRNDRSGPVWREYWQQLFIIGETRVSWLCGYREDSRLDSYLEKVPKRGGYGVAFSEEELDRLEWIETHRHKIVRLIERNEDYATLKIIANLVGYKEKDDAV